jgi:6-phosphogluconolactonase (cycloisomerase 2 family)
MTNAATGNSIVVYQVNSDGTLGGSVSVATGGTGSGTSLENQGALAVTEDARFILAVNPGSDEISVFSASKGSAALLGKIPSGGKHPISIATARGIVYVLNAGGDVGGADNITGFKLAADGALTPIASSTRALSLNVTSPAQIGISPTAAVVVVAERGQSQLHSFHLDAQGAPVEEFVRASSGTGPFGFAFGSATHLYVSEFIANSASSYLVAGTGDLQPISGPVTNGQKAVCWLAVTPDERFAYTTNTGSGTISGYALTANGEMHLLNADGVTARGTVPFDLAISRSGVLMYVLSRRTGIDVFRIDPANGVLTKAGSVTGLPSSSNGILVY